MASAHADHRTAKLGRNPQGAGLGQQFGIDRAAQLDNRRNHCPAAGQREGIPPAAVMRCHHHNLAADRHAKTMEISPRGRCQHHAGHIVAFEHQRALDRALREHDLARADAPQLLARAVSGFGQVIGQPFDCANEVVVIITERRGARQQGYVGRIGEIAQRGFKPGGERRVGQCAAAQHIVFIQQNYLFARRGGFQRCIDPGRTGADDQHIAVGISR